IHDLTGTGVTQVNIDLGSPPGSNTGDGAADKVIVDGTSGDDVIFASSDATGVHVQGLAALVHITGAEVAFDQLVINAGDGDDAVQASNLAANSIQFVANGEAGNDVLIGGPGNDTLNGGDGDDILLGLAGADILDGGLGDNIVIQ